MGINSGGLINSRGFYSHLIVSKGLRNVKIWTPKFSGINPRGGMDSKSDKSYGNDPCGTYLGRWYGSYGCAYLTSSYLCLQPWAPKSLGINSGGLINSKGFCSHLIVSKGLRNVKIWTPKFLGIIPGGLLIRSRGYVGCWRFSRWCHAEVCTWLGHTSYQCYT